MNEGETPKKSEPSAAGNSLAAFHYALIGVQIESGQLVTAIRLRDCEDVQIAAGDAVASYLAAKAALRRVELRSTGSGEAGEHLRTANLALGACRRVLEDLFERASVQIAEPSLHSLLRQLRTSLALASDEPPPAGLDN